MSKRALLFIALVAVTACRTASPVPVAEDAAPAPVDVDTHAAELAHRFVIVDGHVDLPHRLHEERAKTGSNGSWDPATGASSEGDFDVPRAKKGGLDAPFMSIYIPAANQKTAGASKQLADDLIDMVEALAKESPDKLAIARTPDEIRENHAAGKISLPMGIENGAALEDDLANVRHFFDRGVRYITLTHSENNLICDSSYAEDRKWNGLSPYGRQVVEAMNRVGIMIDVSHVSDDAFKQAVELSQTPVIASHSSCRHFTPDFERNPSDELIQLLAAKGGVIMINFGSGFILEAAQKASKARWDVLKPFMEAEKVEFGDPKVEAFLAEYDAAHPKVFATVSTVADHIDHVVKLVGIDHVGFGSDFDGVGDSLPDGLKDVSMLPNLIAELLRRGYSDADVEKIASGNVFRVWSAVQAYAQAHGDS